MTAKHPALEELDQFYDRYTRYLNGEIGYSELHASDGRLVDAHRTCSIERHNQLIDRIAEAVAVLGHDDWDQSDALDHAVKAILEFKLDG